MPSTNLQIDSCSFSGLNCVLVSVPSQGTASRLDDLVEDLGSFLNELSVKSRSPKLSISKKPSISKRNGAESYHYLIFEDQNHGEKEQVIKSGVMITPRVSTPGTETYFVCFDARDHDYHKTRYSYLNHMTKLIRK